jgi:hypothetical protein
MYTYFRPTKKQKNNAAATMVEWQLIFFQTGFQDEHRFSTWVKQNGRASATGFDNRYNGKIFWKYMNGIVHTINICESM